MASWLPLHMSTDRILASLVCLASLGCASATRERPHSELRAPLELEAGGQTGDRSTARGAALPEPEPPTSPPADVTPAVRSDEAASDALLPSTTASQAKPAYDLLALRARFGPRIQILADGRFRRMMHVPHGAAPQLKQLIEERWLPERFAPGNEAGNEVGIELGADVTLTTARNLTQPRAKDASPTFTTDQNWQKVTVADWLIVTGDQATQMETDQWLNAWWTGRDHIEVRVLVMERELNDSDDFGSITEILPSSVNAALQGVSSAFPNSISGGGVFRFQDADKLNSTLQWISRHGETQIQSAPSIIFRDHGSARISALTRTPYLQVDRLDATGQASTFKIAFADTGVRMNVAASVVGQDRIFLELEIAVTSLNTALTNPDIPAPALSETSLPVPRVTITDGQSLWIGGLKSEFSREIERKFPLLGDLPLIGFFFKSILQEKRKTEVIFVLTPTIRRNGSALPAFAEDGSDAAPSLFDRIGDMESQ